MNPPENLSFHFTEAEIEKLKNYRAAVSANFYNDLDNKHPGADYQSARKMHRFSVVPSLITEDQSAPLTQTPAKSETTPQQDLLEGKPKEISTIDGTRDGVGS